MNERKMRSWSRMCTPFLKSLAMKQKSKRQESGGIEHLEMACVCVCLCVTGDGCTVV